MAEETKVITLDEVIEGLGYDYADDVVKANLNRAIDAADFYLKGSLGVNYPKEDPRVKQLALIVVSDLYDNRGLYEPVSGNTRISNNVRKLVTDFSLQIKCEIARGLYG